MANRRWTENDILTTFNNFSAPITDMNEGAGGVDKQMGVEQFRHVAEYCLMDSDTNEEIDDFNNPLYLQAGIHHFATITGANNAPNGVMEDNCVMATLEVFGGKDPTSPQGFTNYIVQRLTYVNLTKNHITTEFRGVLLSESGNFSNSTGWNSFVDSAKTASSLQKGATMNGELVAGQNWVSSEIKTLKTGLEDGTTIVAKSTNAEVADNAGYAGNSAMLGGVASNKYALKSETLTLDGITAGAKSLSYIGEGRNLMTVLQASSVQDCFRRLQALNGNYKDLLIGDYIDIPSITVDGIGTLQNVSGNLRVEIAGFDHYRNVGDTATGRGILFTFRNCAFTHGMNPTNTNANGYFGSNLRTILNGAFATGLEQAIGVPLKAVRRLAEKHNSASWWTNWVSEKCFLPTEVEVWGHQIWGNAGYSTGTSIQYPIYSLDPDRRLKNYNGNRIWWWTGTSCVKGDNEQPSSTNFCGVGGDGCAGDSGASFGGGVSPAFYI